MFNAAVAQALNVELMEQGEAIVHVFKGQIRGGNPRPLIELAPGLGGLRLDLLQRGRETPGGGPARRMVEDVDGLLLHISGPLRRSEEVGRGDHRSEERRVGKECSTEETRHCW